MCVQCVVYSALMVFAPAPQPAINVAQANVPEAVYSQANGSKVARDTQNAIDQMLKQLPTTPDTMLLRTELNSLYGRLATVKDDAEAQSLIDNSLRSLSDRFKDQPNYQQINQNLMSILEVKDNQPSAKALGLKVSHNTVRGIPQVKTVGGLF